MRYSGDIDMSIAMTWRVTDVPDHPDMSWGVWELETTDAVVWGVFECYEDDTRWTLNTWFDTRNEAIYFVESWIEDNQ